MRRRVEKDISHWPKTGGVLRGSGRGGLNVIEKSDNKAAGQRKERTWTIIGRFVSQDLAFGEGAGGWMGTR
jgi:hypothetical protein